jgi:hypothetical protein
MTDTISIFRFAFRFVGKSETAKATMFSVPTPLRGRAESGIGVFRLCEPFPFFKKLSENAGQRP